MSVMETFRLRRPDFAQGEIRGANRNRTGAAFRLAATITATLTLLLAQPAQAKCRTHKCWARVSEKRHAHYWPRRFKVQPAGWRAWAHSTSWCESRNRRVARESGFWSYFQWTLTTWHVAGGSGNPEQHSYPEQAVKAIRYARRYGSRSWPVCG